ncbi:MAG: 1-acyl-sn-glycerol-3-phosphate acyltransferase [Tannerella sp.]|jgi:1-acyl-sn-glycerol-3-phosphate acyltransferase|nr:1-acyl-sn-glycerol-3-phosphate acyltransferase [Tannerella sp.]
MTKFLLSVYDYFSQHKGQLFTLLALLTVLFAGMALHVRFKEDISGFLPETTENERINNAYRYIASANHLIVYCSGKDSTDRTADAQIEAVERLANRLQTLDSTCIKSLRYKVEPAEMAALTSFVVNNMPYFLDDADYERMDTLFSKASIADRLRNNRDLFLSPAGIVFRESILSDPLRITGPVMSKLQSFQTGDRFQLYQDHIFTDDHKAVLLIECTMPVSETARNAALIDSLNRFTAEVERTLEGNVGFQRFGASEIALGNASQIKKDTLFSSLLAFILIFALLIYSFRNGKKILLIFLSTLFGGLFALAFLYLIRGEVSVIAVGISSIMFGIAINYPLHFIGHYNHTPHPRRVIKDIIEPLTIGNITTVGAFLSLVFVGSDAMGDLGWFASLLLIGTILFVLFFLPHLLPSSRKAVCPPEHTLFARFVGQPFEKNRWVVMAVVLLTLFFSFFSGDARFETNMQKINYMTASQQKEYQRMMELLNTNRHILYYVTEGDDLNRALEANESLSPMLHALMDGGRIYDVGGIGNFYPSRARRTERIDRWNVFWSARRDSVLALLHEESRNAGFKPDAFQSFENMVRRTWEPVDLSHFNLIRETLARNYIIDTGEKSMVVNLLYTDAANAPALEEELNRFDASSISFDAGSITRRMIASLSDNFNYVLCVCGLIVFAFLIVSLGRPELSIIAFIPLALSWIWILGLMHLFDIHFNIVNIILATFIFGQGDDYTIFMTEGLMYEYTFKRKMLASYKNSIALSALIMFIGMGMLIFAKHPALRSLAEVTIVGMLSVVIMSWVLPPFLFHALTLRKGKKRLMPVTLKNGLSTLWAFFFFLLMSAVITLFGWILFTFGPTTEKKKRAFHQLLYRVARFVIYRVPQIQTTFQNLSGETFEKPSVIICNHQSHLDLMCILMLTPKLVVMTNDWVWNSPFYGRMIKYADFYPVSGGIENALGRLEEVMRRGYSIVVFPEGTRSADCSIQRFHRGAFFLAERLQADIVPVLVHGVGHALPKQEFMLRKGAIHVRVMERITLHDARFSPDYSLRSRQVRRFYQEQYQALCREIETPEYYSDPVIHNYIYKGPSIERTVRRNLRRHQNFATQIARLPDAGRVWVRNSGYGEFTLLLSLVKKQLQVVGIEKDPDLREIAANCASNPANLRYVDDESSLAGEPADVCITVEGNDMQ